MIWVVMVLVKIIWVVMVLVMAVQVMVVVIMINFLSNLVLLIRIGVVRPPEQCKVIVPTKKSLLSHHHYRQHPHHHPDEHDDDADLVEDVELLPRGELLVADCAGEAAKVEHLLIIIVHGGQNINIDDGGDGDTQSNTRG